METYSRSWLPNEGAGQNIDYTDVSRPVEAEFHSAEFGDSRLTDRLTQIGAALGRCPAESIPSACEDWAATKATYRFCDNENVGPKEILSAHKQSQMKRLTGTDELLLISDITQLTFPGHTAKEGLGEIGTSDMDHKGVKVHSTIGVLPNTNRMTGIIDQQVFVENRQNGPNYVTNGNGNSESLQNKQKLWIRGDRQASDWLADTIRPICIHDRGADAFPLYTELTTELEDAGFIVRANQNRCIRTLAGQDDYLLDWSEQLSESGQTTVRLQQGGDRESRD